ncbi:hypothetical protein Tco_0381735 [Tanacetum coccineum]
MVEEQAILHDPQWNNMTVDNVLGGNYSSTKQVNSIQQLLAYCLITRTEVDIEEIIYSDLVTKLLNKSRLKFNSYPRFISCALQVLLGCDYTYDKDSVSPPLLSAKKKKGKSQTMTPMLPKSQGPKAFGELSKKRKQPKPKRHLRNIELASTGLPSTLDEGTRKSQPLPEGTGAKYKVDQTQSTRLRYQSLTKKEGEPSYEGEPDAQPLVLSIV